MEKPKVEVKFSEWIQDGFNLYKENALLLIVATLLASVIGGVTGGILIGPMMAGMILITLKLYEKKVPKPEIGDVFKGFDYFLQTFLFYLVWGFGLTLASQVLFLIPMIGPVLGIAGSVVAGTLVVFGMFLIVDKKMDFWPASMASLNLVKANFAPILGLVLVASIISYIGVIACIIGVVVTMPIYVCIMTVAYRKMFA